MCKKFFFLTLILLILGLTSTTFAQIDGLVGYWPFEGDPNDASGSGHDGTIVGTPQYVEGKFGQGIRIASTDTINLGTWNPLEANNQFSVLLWVYEDVGTNRTSNYQIISKRDGWTDATMAWQVESLKAGAGSTQFRSRNQTVGGGSGIVEGEWLYLAATFDGTYGRLYANGVLVAGPGTTPMTITAPGAMIKIGGEAGVQHFLGIVDEARIYDRALTAEEILALMAGGGSCSPWNGATGVAQNAVLSWEATPDAVEYHVYFGTDADLVYGGDPSVDFGPQPATDFAPDMDWETQYFWRVDVVFADEVVTGEVWSFTTTGTRICAEPLEGDINEDCVVDLKDLAMMVGDWMLCNLTNGDCP